MRFKEIQKNLFLATLLIITIVFLWLINSYLLAIFWAVVLAIIFYPVKKIFLKILDQREILSTILTILVMLVVVFVPLYVLGLAITNETISLYRQVSTQEKNLDETLEMVNRSIPVFSWLNNVGWEKEEITQKISGLIKSLGAYVLSKVKNLGQETFRFLLHFFIMLYLLFFFLKDGIKLLKKIQYLLPLGNEREARLFARFVSTVRATVKGTFIIAIVQGFLGALLFWLVGISAPMLWGALMAILSILPAIGPFLIWAPAGLILIFSGSVWPGIAVLLVGALVISSVDNILRPPLVGKDTQMPDALVLLSTLGGLTIFGISGFVIGPVIAAFFLSMWKMFAEEYKQELNDLG